MRSRETRGCRWKSGLHPGVWSVAESHGNADEMYASGEPDVVFLDCLLFLIFGLVLELHFGQVDRRLPFVR